MECRHMGSLKKEHSLGKNNTLVRWENSTHFNFAGQEPYHKMQSHILQHWKQLRPTGCIPRSQRWKCCERPAEAGGCKPYWECCQEPVQNEREEKLENGCRTRFKCCLVDSKGKYKRCWWSAQISHWFFQIITMPNMRDARSFTIAASESWAPRVARACAKNAGNCGELRRGPASKVDMIWSKWLKITKTKFTQPFHYQAINWSQYVNNGFRERHDLGRDFWWGVML